MERKKHQDGKFKLLVFAGENERMKKRCYITYLLTGQICTVNKTLSRKCVNVFQNVGNYVSHFSIFYFGELER